MGKKKTKKKMTKKEKIEITCLIVSTAATVTSTIIAIFSIKK